MSNLFFLREKKRENHTGGLVVFIWAMPAEIFSTIG
jgi:hypothetical protein